MNHALYLWVLNTGAPLQLYYTVVITCYVVISYSRFSSVNIVLFLSSLLLLVILGFTRLTLLYSLVSLSNLGFTRLNSVNVSISIETLCNLQFNLVKLVYFLVNSSVIFTRLILGLRSLKSG